MPWENRRVGCDSNACRRHLEYVINRTIDLLSIRANYNLIARSKKNRGGGVKSLHSVTHFARLRRGIISVGNGGFSMEAGQISQFGTIDFGPDESVEVASPLGRHRPCTVTRAAGIWRPSERLAELCQAGVDLPIDRYTLADRQRRYLVRESLEELIDVGAVVGLEIILATQGHASDSHDAYSYRRMHSVFQYVRGRGYRNERGMRAHMTRQFGSSRDLYIRPSGRDSNSEWNVMPGDVGLDANGQGERWSIQQLTERGRMAARSAGFENPTNEIAIAFGLYEAARQNPAYVPSENVRNLVQISLFDMPSGRTDLYPALIEMVTERLLRAIDRHREDSPDEFDRWFLGPNNSIVRSIAEQRRSPGGILLREDVVAAMLLLGWEAYDYVGQCVHAFMRTVKHAIEGQHTDEERHSYEQMYEAQDCYGGLPLALLSERMGFLRPVITQMLQEGDTEELVPVLHRLLLYYSDMSPRRRQSDRTSKSRPRRSADVIRPSGRDQESSASENEGAEETQVMDAERVGFFDSLASTDDRIRRAVFRNR